MFKKEENNCADNYKNDKTKEVFNFFQTYNQLNNKAIDLHKFLNEF